ADPARDEEDHRRYEGRQQQHALPAARSTAGTQRGHQCRGRRSRKPDGDAHAGAAGDHRRWPHAGSALMPRLQSIVIGALVLVALAWGSLFQVNENELAIRTQLGRIVGENYGPGLHMKWPLINRVYRFERRIITQAYTGETFLTSR